MRNSTSRSRIKTDAPRRVSDRKLRPIPADDLRRRLTVFLATEHIVLPIPIDAKAALAAKLVQHFEAERLVVAERGA